MEHDPRARPSFRMLAAQLETLTATLEVGIQGLKEPLPCVQKTMVGPDGTTGVTTYRGSEKEDTLDH